MWAKMVENATKFYSMCFRNTKTLEIVLNKNIQKRMSRKIVQFPVLFNTLSERKKRREGAGGEPECTYCTLLMNKSPYFVLGHYATMSKWHSRKSTMATKISKHLAKRLTYDSLIQADTSNIASLYLYCMDSICEHLQCDAWTYAELSTHIHSHYNLLRSSESCISCFGAQQSSNSPYCIIHTIITMPYNFLRQATLGTVDFHVFYIGTFFLCLTVFKEIIESRQRL